MKMPTGPPPLLSKVPALGSRADRALVPGPLSLLRPLPSVIPSLPGPTGNSVSAWVPGLHNLSHFPILLAPLA